MNNLSSLEERLDKYVQRKNVDGTGIHYWNCLNSVNQMIHETSKWLIF